MCYCQVFRQAGRHVPLPPRASNPRLQCGGEVLIVRRRALLCSRLRSEWNPAIDPHLAFNYSIDNFAEGKAKNKEALQVGTRVPVGRGVGLGFRQRTGGAHGCPPPCDDTPCGSNLLCLFGHPRLTPVSTLPCPDAPTPTPRAPQKELGLPVNKDIPLIAFIGRLDPQKGADILLGAAPSLLQYNNVQVGAVGAGTQQHARGVRCSARPSASCAQSR